MLGSQMIPNRVRNKTAYRRGQPDLDIYSECWAGFAAPGFAMSDVDGLVCVHQQVHGVVERKGYFVLLEHKREPGDWMKSRGQWLALNSVGETLKACNGRGYVVVTYGPTNNPNRYHILPVDGWRSIKTSSEFSRLQLSPQNIEDPETTWARRWIKMVNGR
jgi:hypothetical protein